jgi:membrane protein
MQIAVDYGRIVKETLIGWWEDKAPRLGAALAFYTILSIAPIVILALPVASLIFGRPQAEGSVVKEFEELVGNEGAKAVRAIVTAPPEQSRSTLATTVGLVVLAFGATGVFAQLQDALNTIWEVVPVPNGNLIWAFLRQRFLSFAMVLGICFLLLVSLVLSAGLSAARAYMDQRLASVAFTWTIAHTLASFGVITILFAMMFKVLPDVDVPWRDVWLGALITAALFTLGKTVIGLYLGRSAISRAYGGAGSLVALLLWVYYSSQILFLGAEFTHAYAKVRGSRVHPTPIAVPVTDEARAQQGIPRHQTVEQAACERNHAPAQTIQNP